MSYDRCTFLFAAARNWNLITKVFYITIHWCNNCPNCLNWWWLKSIYFIKFIANTTVVITCSKPRIFAHVLSEWYNDTINCDESTPSGTIFFFIKATRPFLTSDIRDAPPNTILTSLETHGHNFTISFF